MITIQELHQYYRMSQVGVVPKITCPMNDADGEMIPWVDAKERACMWCLSCNLKLYLGINKIEKIRSLLHQ